MELSLLCGIKIELVMEDVTHSKYVKYQSVNDQDLFVAAKTLGVKEIYTNKDVSLPLYPSLKASANFGSSN
jgi:hypothetical protein